MLKARLAEGGLVEGDATAGGHARSVKHNQQIQTGQPGHDRLEPVVRSALARNITFLLAVRPRRMRPVLFNRYATGMSYGPRFDEAMMGYGDSVEQRRDRAA